MLGSLLLSLIMSLSGLRVWLDPASPQYLPALGWVDSTASMLRGTTVPLALFSCGVFLHGKRFWRGNVAKAGVVLVLKCVVLPALMLACAKAVRLGADSGVALVLLSMTPCATTAFVVASQYNRGAEVRYLPRVCLLQMWVALL
jgi:predicted permease